MSDDMYQEIIDAVQGEKKSVVLPPLRVTKTERDIIKKKASEAGLSLSDYIRKSCINAVIITPPSLGDYKLVQALNKIGTNLNQYVKKLQGLGKDSPQEVVELCGRIDSLINEIVTFHVSEDT